MLDLHRLAVTAITPRRAATLYSTLQGTPYRHTPRQMFPLRRAIPAAVYTAVRLDVT